MNTSGGGLAACWLRRLRLSDRGWTLFADKGVLQIIRLKFVKIRYWKKFAKMQRFCAVEKVRENESGSLILITLVNCQLYLVHFVV